MDLVINLLEKNRIIDQVTELFVATDLRDWSRVQTCFTDKVHFDQTSLIGGKPTDVASHVITDGWDKGLKQIKAIHHQIGNIQIEIDNDSAGVMCYGIAFHYLPNSTGKDTRTFVGSYELKLIKQDNSWKINTFVYKIKFIDGNKDLENSKS